MTKIRLTAVAVTFALVVAACSGGASPTTPTESAGGGSTTSVTSGSASGVEPPSTTTTEPKATTTEPKATATLTVGDESWTVENVVCQFGEAESGSPFILQVEGAADNLQLSISIRDLPIGLLHEVTLVQNGMTLWIADDRYGENGQSPEDFIIVEGRTVSGDATFYPSAGQLIDSPETGTPGRFEANCG